MSVTMVRILREGKEDERDEAVWERVEAVRPRSAMDTLPDWANECAREGPRPLPAPVMTMILPRVLREGRRGEMEG